MLQPSFSYDSYSSFSIGCEKRAVLSCGLMQPLILMDGPNIASKCWNGRKKNQDEPEKTRTEVIIIQILKVSKARIAAMKILCIF